MFWVYHIFDNQNFCACKRNSLERIDLDFDTNIRVKTDDADYSMVMSRISCPLKLKWDSVVYST